MNQMQKQKHNQQKNLNISYSKNDYHLKLISQ